MAYQVILDRPDAYRVLLEEYPEGTYVDVFETKTSEGPYKDYLQDDLAMAMHACRLDFGVEPADWCEVPDENWHGRKREGGVRA